MRENEVRESYKEVGKVKASELPTWTGFYSNKSFKNENELNRFSFLDDLFPSKMLFFMSLKQGDFFK